MERVYKLWLTSKDIPGSIWKLNSLKYRTRTYGRREYKFESGLTVQCVGDKGGIVAFKLNGTETHSHDGVLEERRHVPAYMVDWSELSKASITTNVVTETNITNTLSILTIEGSGELKIVATWSHESDKSLECLKSVMDCTGLIYKQMFL